MLSLLVQRLAGDDDATRAVQLSRVAVEIAMNPPSGSPTGYAIEAVKKLEAAYAEQFDTVKYLLEEMLTLAGIVSKLVAEVEELKRGEPCY